MKLFKSKLVVAMLLIGASFGLFSSTTMPINAKESHCTFQTLLTAKMANNANPTQLEAAPTTFWVQNAAGYHNEANYPENTLDH